MAINFSIMTNIDHHPSITIEDDDKFISFHLKNYYLSGGLYVAFIDNVTPRNVAINTCIFDTDKLTTLVNALEQSKLNLELGSAKIQRELGSCFVPNDFDDLERVRIGRCLSDLINKDRELTNLSLHNLNYVVFKTTNEKGYEGKIVIASYSDYADDEQVITISSGICNKHEMTVSF